MTCYCNSLHEGPFNWSEGLCHRVQGWINGRDAICGVARLVRILISSSIAIRMWRLGRRGIRHRLAELGVPVGTWGEGVELDEVLRPMSLRPLLGSRK